MRATRTQVDNNVLELLELANVNSPFASQLVNSYCVRMTNRMLRSGKIDEDTANQLCQRIATKKPSGDDTYFLVN